MQSTSTNLIKKILIEVFNELHKHKILNPTKHDYNNSYLFFCHLSIIMLTNKSFFIQK